MKDIEFAYKHLENIMMHIVRLGLKPKLTKRDKDALMIYGTFGIHYLASLKPLVEEVK